MDNEQDSNKGKLFRSMNAMTTHVWQRCAICGVLHRFSSYVYHRAVVCGRELGGSG